MRGRFERMERCDYVKRPWPMPRNRHLARVVTRVPWVSRLYENADPARLGRLAVHLAGRSGARTARPAARRRGPVRGAHDAQGEPAALAAVHRGPAASPNSFTDPNDWRVRGQRCGLWFAPLTMRNGGGVSRRDCLRTAQIEHPGKLTIRPSALVCRELFEGTRAVRVEYLRGRHVYRGGSTGRRRRWWRCAPPPDYGTLSAWRRCGWRPSLVWSSSARPAP